MERVWKERWKVVERKRLVKGVVMKPWEMGTTLSEAQRRFEHHRGDLGGVEPYFRNNTSTQKLL